MKVLVTGSAGFIGMNLTKSLLLEGHTVVGIDNFNDYYDVNLKRARHAEIDPHPNFTGIESDLCDMEALQDCFKQNSFDVVCNLAAQAGVRYSIECPHVYQKANLEAFLNILECCRHNNVPRLVYASSSSVYGGNTKLPFSESDSVDSPVSLYAATKKANELMAHCYTHLYGLQTIGLRFFTVYGPWGRPDMAMWLFTKAMLAGKPIQVFNNGKMQRDFTFVDDIVNGLILAENSVKGLAMNLGGGNRVTLLHTIETLAEVMGRDIRIDFSESKLGDVPDTWASAELAFSEMGWKPSISLEEGLLREVNWLRS